MPRGNGFCAGMGRQMRGYGYGQGQGFAGNTQADCRFNPSLHRRWWATSNSPAPAAPAYAAAVPLESEYLQEQAQFLKTQLEEIEKRLAHLDKKEFVTKE
ncbi:MAG: DUF5320 domain-containing protein [Desulfotomaculaceae bacterium]